MRVECSGFRVYNVGIVVYRRRRPPNGHDRVIMAAPQLHVPPKRVNRCAFGRDADAALDVIASQADQEAHTYRGTSLIRKRHPLGPYSRAIYT